MAVLVAALPVLAGMGLGLGLGVAATQRTRPARPVSPRSSVDCFPIGRVDSPRPATPVHPRAAPRLPAPVPIPEVAITCSSDLLVGSRIGGGR